MYAYSLNNILVRHSYFHLTHSGKWKNGMSCKKLICLPPHQIWNIQSPLYCISLFIFTIQANVMIHHLERQERPKAINRSIESSKQAKQKEEKTYTSYIRGVALPGSSATTLNRRCTKVFNTSYVTSTASTSTITTLTAIWLSLVAMSILANSKVVTSGCTERRPQWATCTGLDILLWTNLECETNSMFCC